MKTLQLLVLVFLMQVMVCAKEQVPDGFVVQKLEPVGGEILRPADWFYFERHGASYRWIISKENLAEQDSYNTGVSIQWFTGIKEGTGKSPEQFVVDFIGLKKKQSLQVYRECAQSSQMLFDRRCIETEEGAHRILYSLFWSDSLDMVVVSIAGAKTVEWEAHEKTFHVMARLKLIDMNRFSGDSE